MIETNMHFPQTKKRKESRLERYAGEWVALVQGEIVEHDAQLPDLMEALEKRNLEKKASVLLVPRKDEGPYILLPVTRHSAAKSFFQRSSQCHSISWGGTIFSSPLLYIF